MLMPFIEMPQRDEALPLMTSRPPRPVAPAYWLASPSMTTVPDIMFSGNAGADRSFDKNIRLFVHAAAIIAG
jgi:hypothetical protein